MTVRPACVVCTTTAFSGRHEPFIVDDVPTWTRLWRCSRCGTLWLEGTPIPRAVGADEVDPAAPRWRDADAWITETSLRDLLRMYSGGSIDGDVSPGQLCIMTCWPTTST